jgi:hypothetical protein
MKCAYHPHKEAVVNCSMCRKPLCDECAEQKVGENIICSRCMALSAANEAAGGAVERQLEHEERKTEADQKGKRRRVVMISVIMLAVLVLLANVYMYMGPKVPEIAQFDPNQHPLLTADLINDGIIDYAKDHDGKFPGSLNDLLEQYLPYDEIAPSVLDRFYYRRFTPTSYELRFKDAESQEFSDIVFGKEDQ